MIYRLTIERELLPASAVIITERMESPLWRVREMFPL